MGQSESLHLDSVPNLLAKDRCNIVAEPRGRVALGRQTALWKMNMAQVSHDSETYFVAFGAEIQCYKADESGMASTAFAILTQTSVQASEINQIRSLFIAEVPVLVAVCDSGDVCIWLQDDLSKPPITVHNDVSTWSLSSSSADSKIYVGANSWKISSFDLDSQHADSTKVEFAGHNHNVPCIEVSPCGLLVASVSIDGTAAVWDAQTGDRLHSMKLLDSWGWSCRWIHKKDIADIARNDLLIELLKLPAAGQDESLAALVKQLQQAVSPQLNQKDTAPADGESKRDPRFMDPDNAEGAQTWFFDHENAEDEYLEGEDDLAGFEEDEEDDDDGQVDQIEQVGDSGSDGSAGDFDGTEGAVPANAGLPQIDHLALVPVPEELPSPEMPPAKRMKSDTDTKPSQSPFIGFSNRKLGLSSSVSLSSSGARPQQKNQREEPLTHIQDYVLLCSSFNEMVLFDSEFKIAATLAHVISGAPGAPGALHSMERLSVVEFIPELSLIVAVSQGACALLLLSLVRDLATGLYELRPRKRLPENGPIAPVAGLCITKLKGAAKPTWRLCIFYQSGVALFYDVYQDH